MAHTRYELRPVSKRPERKVVVGTSTSVIGVPIVAWLANDVLMWNMPEQVAAEIAILIGGIVGYMIRNRG